jgi:L-aminopeptidase/D-esterase-like protein
MLTEVEGIRIGHWTDEVGRTGCTVVLFPEGTVASGEIRGGAPATRDFALLEPGRLVERLDAVVLSGGSAFGLAAATGVVDLLEAQGIGFETAGGHVPIVVGMSLFDLGEGDPKARPGPAEARHAMDAASAASCSLGQVGAGTGATVSKWLGREHARPGGLGGAVARSGDVVVAALVAVNASGDIDDGTTNRAIFDGTFAVPDIEAFADDTRASDGVENTTIGIVATNAKLTKVECHLVAQSCHDGFGRAIVPAHLSGDGDGVVVAATGIENAQLNLVRAMATAVTERAIRTSVVPDP